MWNVLVAYCSVLCLLAGEGGDSAQAELSEWPGPEPWGKGDGVLASAGPWAAKHHWWFV